MQGERGGRNKEQRTAIRDRAKSEKTAQNAWNRSSQSEPNAKKVGPRIRVLAATVHSWRCDDRELALADDVRGSQRATVHRTVGQYFIHSRPKCFNT